MAKEKQITKRLTFSEDEVEQALLAAAEARVAAGEFLAFNELSKAALQAFLNPPASSAPMPAGVEAGAAGMAQIAQMLAALQSGQETLRTLVEQSAAQATASAGATANDDWQRLVEQVEPLTAELAAMRTSQQALAAIVQDLVAVVETTPATTPPDSRLDTLSQQMHTLQSAQQALHAEMQLLADHVTAALANLQARPVNGVHQPVVKSISSTSSPVVSAAAVNRLARFLEDF